MRYTGKRLFNKGRHAAYKPEAIIKTVAMRMLSEPKTWPQMLATGYRASWWQDQVFALEWMGLARWFDPVNAHHNSVDNNRGSTTGTWCLTSAGRAHLANLN